MKLTFENSLNSNDIDNLNRLGYWINQSFLIRLYTILEYHKVISVKIKIRKDFEGADELDILHKLRRIFSHTSRYNPENDEQRLLYDRIVSHFKLTEYHPELIPIPVDTVIEVLVNKIKTYINRL